MKLADFAEMQVKAVLDGHSVESVQDKIRKYVFSEFSHIATFDRMIAICMEVYHAIMVSVSEKKTCTIR